MSNEKEKPQFASDGKSVVANSLVNLLSSEQVRQIRILAAELKLHPDDASREIFAVPFDYLSKSGADDLIKHLRQLKGETKARIIPFKPKSKE